MTAVTNRGYPKNAALLHGRSLATQAQHVLHESTNENGVGVLHDSTNKNAVAIEVCPNVFMRNVYYFATSEVTTHCKSRTCTPS
jgi:hypothetical protein